MAHYSFTNISYSCFPADITLYLATPFKGAPAGLLMYVCLGFMASTAAH